MSKRPHRVGSRFRSPQWPWRCTPLGLLVALAGAGSAASPSLQLALSNETIPAGATGQVKVWVASPTPIASGGFNIYFDPSVFAGITGAGAFGSNGNANAKVGIVATALGATFSSVPSNFNGVFSDDIGRLPDLPVFTIDVTVNPGVAAGTKSTFTLDTTPAPWTDANGNTYSVTVVPGSVTVGGSLAISDVEPGGGILPAGTVVKISGTGFDPAAALTVDGVSVGSVQVVSSQEIDFTIGAAAELTGKRVAVSNPDGSQAEYFPILDGVAPNGSLYVFPLRTGTVVSVGPNTDIVQNPNLFPIIVSEFGDTSGLTGLGAPTSVAPGQVVMLPGVGSYQEALISSNGPMRDFLGFFDAVPPSTEPSLPPMIDFAAAAGSNSTLSKTVSIDAIFPTPANVSVTTQSDSSWLSASVTSPSGLLTITANPAGLAPGTYLGTVTGTVTSPILPSVTGSATTVVRLDVASGGITEVGMPEAGVGASARPPYQAEYPLDTNLFPSGVMVAVTTDSSGNWLTAT